MSNDESPDGADRRPGRGSFDQGAWADALAAVITARCISDRQAASEAGVQPSTITRCVRQDKHPDVQTMAALADWAGLPLELFVNRTRPLEWDAMWLPDARRLLAALRAARDAADAAMGAHGEAGDVRWTGSPR